MNDYDRIAWHFEVQAMLSLVEAFFWLISAACYFAALFVY